MFSVLLLPGALRSFLPSLLGRLALAIAGLALVLAVQSASGSFATAGAVSAVFGLANVVASPWRARALDRWGASLVLALLGTVQAAGFGLIAVTMSLGHPALAVLIALAGLAGLSAPPFGAAMRVTWADLTTPGVTRSTAFSLDATCDEIVFVVGPIIAASVVTLVSGPAALALVAAITLVATAGFASSRVVRSQRGSRRTDQTAPSRVLGLPGFARVLVVLCGVGVVLGTFEIATPAVATAAHAEVVSGWLLAALSVGSAVGGVVYGHLRWRIALDVRLFCCAVGIGLVTVVSALATGFGLVAFGVTAVVVGLFLAPALITGYLAADDMAPAHARTEASAWTNTALNLGASIATAVAGLIIAGPGPAVALIGAAVVALVAAAVTPFGRLARVNTAIVVEPENNGA
ncbi:MFS transporter [Humibacter soli]